jgi:DNA-3-methyladenine glycosylase
MKRLPRKFYRRPTIDVAIDLLGCHIISKKNGVKTGGMIVETEAYVGEDDPACHAYRGMTERNKIMYGPPGYLYVYFTYGNHFMINVVTEKPGFPSAVLLRGVEPLYRSDLMARRRGCARSVEIASGPGKLAAALGITKSDNGADLLGGSIYIAGRKNKKRDIAASPRIGIGDRGSEKLWRFYLIGIPHVSRSPKGVREKSLGLIQARRSGFSIY